MTFDTKQLALSALLAATCGMAQANALPTEAFTTSVDVVDAFFGGTLLDTAITNISNESYTGIARTAVYDTGHGLDFYYQFANSAASVNGVERFTGYDFSSLEGNTPVNVYQTSSAFGIFTAGSEIADYADRTTRGVIGFSFVPNGASKITPGTTSYTTIIRTDARAYTAGHFGLLDGIGDNAVGFAPTTSPVPEPATGSMMLVGLGVLCLIGYGKLNKR